MNPPINLPVLVLLFLVLCAGVLISGCTQTGHQVTSLSDVIQIAPETYTLVSYADISTISKNPVLSAGFGEDLSETIPALHNIPIDTIDVMGWYASPAVSHYDMATVIGGDLKKSVIEQNLHDAGYNSESYSGYDLYCNPDQDDYVSVIDSLLITGTRDAVTGTIDVLTNTKKSAYSTDPAMRDLAESLPGGFLSVVMTGSAVSFLDMDGMATDMALVSDGTVQGMVIIMVQDETVLQELHEDISSQYDAVLASMPPVFEDADITITQNKIIFTGTVPTESLFSDDTYTSLFF